MKYTRKYQKGGKLDYTGMGIGFMNNPIIYKRGDFKGNKLSKLANKLAVSKGIIAAEAAEVTGADAFNRKKEYGNLYDLYNYYFAQPLESNILNKSKYKPSISTDKNAEYISINDDIFKKQIIDLAKKNNIKQGETKKVSGYQMDYEPGMRLDSFFGMVDETKMKESYANRSKTNAIGRLIVSKGKDEKGEYISYYDKFDFKTGKRKGMTFGAAKSYEIYDRIYLNENKKYGGTMKTKIAHSTTNNLGSSEWKRTWHGTKLPTSPYKSGFYPRPTKDWGGALTGASTGTKMGASIGSIFGPLGGLIGGGIGAITGGLFGNRAENKKIRAQKKADAALQLEEDKATVESERLRKKQLYDNDSNYLANMDLVESDSMFMKKGGKIAANGKTLKDGNKLLTVNGSTSGSHETGQNIPLKKKGRVIAYAEPGEVLVNDKDMPMTPFVLSKRIGRNGTSFAEEFLNLEGMKNRYNKNIIEDRQANLIRSNNKFVGGSKTAALGYNFFTDEMVDYGKKLKAEKRKELFGKLSDGFGKATDIAGTVGNLLMTNKTLKRQRSLINDSLTRALNYNPTYNKNYLLNDQIDVSDQTSAINQGYASSISNLSQIDPAIASALKNTANTSRVQNLNSVYGERNRQRIGLRNQNTMNIMANNTANTDLSNQTNLMKLNARIATNEQLGDLESTKLSNVQGAISEYNTIRRDNQSLDSLRARWKDSIGRDAEGSAYSDFEDWYDKWTAKKDAKKADNFKCGGKIRKRKRTMKY